MDVDVEYQQNGLVKERDSNAQHGRYALPLSLIALYPDLRRLISSLVDVDMIDKTVANMN